MGPLWALITPTFTVFVAWAWVKQGKKTRMNAIAKNET
jgi:hypothetical protein